MRTLVSGTIALTATCFVAGCADLPTVTPTEVVVEASKPSGKGGGKPPSVDSAVPPAAPPNTQLEVRVLGSGFDNGSQARWLRSDGSGSEVVTLDTRFVSASELVATIQIAEDAEDQSLYDIEVETLRGKKGLGAEVFKVDRSAVITTATFPSASSSPGLYHDGQPDYDVSFTDTKTVAHPSCPRGFTFVPPRSFLELEPCGRFSVAINEDQLVDLANGVSVTVGAPISSDTNFSPNSYYFFREITGRKNKKHNTYRSYNVVWDQGVTVTRTVGHAGEHEGTWRFTTTSPAYIVERHSGVTSAAEAEGPYTIPLDVTIVRR